MNKAILFNYKRLKTFTFFLKSFDDEKNTLKLKANKELKNKSLKALTQNFYSKLCR